MSARKTAPKTAKPSSRSEKKTAKKTAITTASSAQQSSAPVTAKKGKPGEIVVLLPPPEKKAFVDEGLRRELDSHNRPAPAFKTAIQDGSAHQVLVPDLGGGEYVDWVAGVNMVGGGGADSSLLVVNMMAKYATKTYGGVERVHQSLNRMMAQAVALAPRDAIEGMLVSQMVCTYHESMLMLSQASETKQLDQGTYFYNQSARLMRLFMLQLDALNKHRGRGPSEQKVTVQHVHVHEGGQAVVGNVKHGGAPGAGGATEPNG